jgi:serine/threonine protein kinase/DNA-binding CsgD family transcriptional regulator
MAENLSGTQLGPYELLEVLGEGGMATVYRAYQPSMDRPVAVKIIHQEVIQDPTGLERFQREARLIAKLEHAHILPVYDYDGTHRPPYIVMRYLAGGTLRDVLARQTVSIKDAVQLLCQVAAAVDYAHDQCVVHRDIKTSNILIDNQGEAYLADFGIAHVIGLAGGLEAAQAGTVLGTPSYMAPEQIAGQPVSQATDIYALAMVLFEILTGHLPDESRPPIEQMYRRLSEPPPRPTGWNAALPADVDAIMVRALAIDPADRYATAGEFATAAAAALQITLPCPPVALQTGATLISQTDFQDATPPRVKILLVDDDEFNREGVRLYLARNRYEIVEAGDEATAWQQAVTHQPAAAIVDISIPPDPQTPSSLAHNGGVHLAHRLKETYPAMGVILFSAYEDRGREILSLIQAGRRGIGYKLKGSQPAALLNAIKDVLAGRVVLDPEVQVNRQSAAADLLAQLAPDERPWVEGALAKLDTLSAQEQEVAQRLAAAHNAADVAQALSLSPAEVETTIRAVYTKLGLADLPYAAPHLQPAVILAKASLIGDLRAGA